MLSVLDTVKAMLGKKESKDFKKYEALFTSLPSFDEIKDLVILDDGKGKTIGQFFDHYKTKSINLSPTTEVAEVDAVREREIYARFIIQFVAELNAVNKIDLLQSKLPSKAKLPFIGIDQLSEISEFLGDTGANINIAGRVGKRRHDLDGEFDLYGAFAGGLGNKISEAEYEATTRSLANPSLSEAQRNKLMEKMLWADNVLFNLGKPSQYIPYVGTKEEDRKRVEVMTVARETMEELGELLIGDYIKSTLATSKRFEEVMQDAFGTKLSKEALAIFKQMGAIINKNVEANTYKVKCYKDDIEPLFREFLKLTPDGKKFTDQFAQVLTGEVVVTDKSFPDAAIFNKGVALAAKGAALDLGVLDQYLSTTAISVPKSVCYLVGERELARDENVMMRSLTSAALTASARLFGSELPRDSREKKASADGKKIKDKAREEASVFEAKGVRTFSADDLKMSGKSASDGFKELLDCFARFHLTQEKADRFFYPHEALAAIQCFIKEEIKTYEQACKAEEVFQYELKNPNFITALEKVSKYNARTPREEPICKDEAEVCRKFFEEPLGQRKSKVRFQEVDYGSAASQASGFVKEDAALASQARVTPAPLPPAQSFARGAALASAASKSRPKSAVRSSSGAASAANDKAADKKTPPSSAKTSSASALGSKARDGNTIG